MSGPGDRAPKHLISRESTLLSHAEDHDVAPTRVDVALTFPPESQDLARSESFLHGSRETSKVPRRQWWAAGNRGKATSRKPCPFGKRA